MSVLTDLVPQSPSCWIAGTADARPPAFPPLADDLDVDVCVVGGGLVGLTTALLLARDGQSVALLEARRVGMQASGHCTGIVSALGADSWVELEAVHGPGAARLHAMAMTDGVARLRALAAGLGVDGTPSDAVAWLWTASRAEAARLREEADAARRAGLELRDADTAPLPFATRAAAWLDGQALLDPLRWSMELAHALPLAGCRIFESTRVTGVEPGDARCLVQTSQGTVTARQVVLATQVPVTEHGAWTTFVHPRAHAVVAARLADAPDDALARGAFRQMEAPRVSLRFARDAHGWLAIASGDAWRPGHADAGAHCAALQDWLRDRLPVTAFEWRWTCEDFDPVDDLPFVGHASRGTERLWVATGFGDRGPAAGTMAAFLLAERIQGRLPPWADLYDATRLNAGAAAKRFLTENAVVAKEWIADHLGGAPRLDPLDLERGEAAVIAGKHGKLAAYRDDGGTLHVVSATCTHKGCTVAWNAVARTWDCPCHGSRFTVDGTVLGGPAVRPLPADSDRPGAIGPDPIPVTVPKGPLAAGQG